MSTQSVSHNISLFSIPNNLSKDLEVVQLLSSLRAVQPVASPIASGTRVESPENLTSVLDWNTGEHTGGVHRAFDASNVPVNPIHAALDSDPTKAIRSPVTEILTATVKADKDIGVFTEMTPKGLGLVANADGFLGTSWGFSLDDPRKLVILTGWASKEIHESLAAAEDVRIFFGPWLEFLSDMEGYHVKFEGY